MLISSGEGGNWKLCKNEKKRLEGEERGGCGGKRSQGREVEEESYDECVCSMKCSKAIN